MNTTGDALERLEGRLGRLLVTGVTVSAIMLLVGLGWFLISQASAAAHVLLTIGLFALMGTPMLRVAVSFVEYVRMKDWFFVATTIIVLAVLVTSVVLALRRL